MPSRHPDFVRAKTIQLTADFISPAGRAWLGNTSAARILHIFKRVCNLINADGEILSVLASPVAMGPFAVRLNESINWSGNISAEMRVKCEEDSIRIADVQIDIGTATPWNPLPQWEHLRNLKDTQLWVNEIRKQLSRAAPPDSIAAIIMSFPGAERRGILSNDPERAASQGFLEPSGSRNDIKGKAFSSLQAVLETAIPKLHAGLRRRDLDSLQSSAQAFAGLGPGLTPAGDDYLVGVMYGLWSTLAPAEATRLSEALAESAGPRTNNISKAWLRAAANGEANADWHQLVQVISSNEVRNITLILTRIMDTGHTSGADALAGFVDTRSILARE